MSKSSDISVPSAVLHIFEETDTNGWKPCDVKLEELKHKLNTNFVVFGPPEFGKKYPHHKNLFQEEFWTVIEDDINGSFHCEYGFTKSGVYPTVSWACFKIKFVNEATKYDWKQPTIHVDWNPDTGRQLVYVFDLPQKEVNNGLFLNQHMDLLKRLPSPEERKRNPFCWHSAFARMMLEEYDTAFWKLRDLVRKHEKERSKSSHKPNDFPLLHDIARHIFHYNETIEVAEHTLQSLVSEQAHWRKENGEGVHRNLVTYIKTYQQLKHEEKRAHSLKTRSKSLNDRHQNEINLAFNLVSQGFGRDARSDSAMMKTIAVVSMVYLPGTFVSGLFGTNFFAFEANPPNTWITSSEFWIYWAVTIPLTLATMLVWAIWHFRDKYQDLWEEYLGKASDSDDRKTDTRTSSKNGGSPVRSGSFGMIQRVATALRPKPVQRKETV